MSKMVRYKSRRQEQSVAKQVDGKTVIASGSLWFADSDVRSDDYLIECKTTSRDSFSVTAKIWEKIEKEAVRDRLRIPLLIIDLRDTLRYVVFRNQDFALDDYEIYDKDIPKSFRLSVKDLGYNVNTFDYTERVTRVVKGEKINFLSAMKWKDFIERFFEVNGTKRYI